MSGHLVRNASQRLPLWLGRASPTNKPDTLKQDPLGVAVSSCKPEANHTLEPDLDLPLARHTREMGSERAREVFLNASMTLSSCLG